MPQTIDYSQKLDEIVRALNRPSISPWTIAIISAGLAVIGGIVGQFIVLLLTDAYKRHKMRRVLYLDIRRMFIFAFAIIASPPHTDHVSPDPNQFARRQFKEHLTFEAEDYMKANKDIFMQLPEYMSVLEIYRVYHMLLEDNSWPGFISLRAITATVEPVRDGTLQAKYSAVF